MVLQTINYKEQLKQDFGSWGKVYTINETMAEITKSLAENGLFRQNSRIVFSVCPDDVNRLLEIETMEGALTQAYNGEFHLGGLGAYPMGGVSGLTAASHHPPDSVANGSRKDGNLILFISPHIGLLVGDDFIYGKIIRPGQEKVTSSCGAMMGFLGALKGAGSPESFSIAPDPNYIDPTRVVLHSDLINNYSDQLKQILAVVDENQQVIDMFKLNYDVVMNKTRDIIKEFLIREKQHFKGKIAIVGGITVNLPSKDGFILKEIFYPTE
ncbi:MAG: hypothetical protein GF383_04730 [Candidatus Lokiarchaeota archaeon]|nr:hypothetical protein [Candidatus Lokiarchaeota archaeon]MBD3339101.1 hypothetical protein [Candidatus Lokiarchaeota archaeon]